MRNKIAVKMVSRMAKQSLRASRMRNIFVMVTIILASALLTAILMFAAGQKQQTKEALSHRQQVSYYNLTGEQLEALRLDSRISSQIQVKTGILSEMDGFDVMPYYVSRLSDDIRVALLESGRMPEEDREIAAQAALLQKMGISPVLGCSVPFTFYDGTTETFILSGLIEGGETAKQFPVFFSQSYAENGGQLKDMPYEVHARLNGDSLLYAEEYRETMYRIGSDAGIQRKYVVPSKAFLDSLSVDVRSVMLYVLIGLVILIACTLVIYGVFYLSVIGRIHQFGQLRTVGMTKKQIGKLISREGGQLFSRAAPVGILIGGVAGYLMVPDGFELLNTLSVIGFVFVTIYVITMISIRRPARLAAAVSPMEALRFVPRDGMKKAAGRKICRRLTPLGLGRMNFSRNRKKTVITMLSLGMGGILFMTAATYMSSFEKENFARQGFFTDAEFHMAYSSSAITLSEYGLSGLQAQCPLDAETVERIAALEGVRNVTAIKSFGVRYDYLKQDEYNNNNEVYPLTAEETAEAGRYLEEGSADYDKLMSGDYVLIAGNDVAEEIFGWRFLPGDRVTLHYYDGAKTTEKEVVILGVLNSRYSLDNNAVEGWFLMPEQAILNLISYDSLNAHLLVSTEPEREEAVGEILSEMVSERSELTLETLADRRIAYNQNADQIFGAITGLSAFIMMFSILSMMNTLITNIITRKQELAMLESIGMGKGQIRAMLLGESLLLTAVVAGATMTVGALCGYGLCSLLYKNGAFYMAFQFPAVLSLAYTGILITVPLLITLVSMRSFSKEPLVERLRGAEA